MTELSYYYSSRLLSSCFGVWLQHANASKAQQTDDDEKADYLWRLAACKRTINGWFLRTNRAKALLGCASSDDADYVDHNALAIRFRQLVQLKKGLLSLGAKARMKRGDSYRGASNSDVAIDFGSCPTVGVAGGGVAGGSGGAATANGGIATTATTATTATASASAASGVAANGTASGTGSDFRADVSVWSSAESMKLRWLRRLHLYR